MINFPVTSFLTGLHFAVLQFGYILLLEINVSSTYLTYMTVVLSWIGGSAGGVWVEKMGAPSGLVLGVLAYYGVSLLVFRAPFSPFSLPLAALGIAVTGLWAGRFFVYMFARCNRADRLFFHENNGFVAGILLFLAGFTLGGWTFLFVTPLSVASLLVLLNALLPKLPGNG